jgi:hypothetical protein
MPKREDLQAVHANHIVTPEFWEEKADELEQVALFRPRKLKSTPLASAANRLYSQHLPAILNQVGQIVLATLRKEALLDKVTPLMKRSGEFVEFLSNHFGVQLKSVLCEVLYPRDSRKSPPLAPQGERNFFDSVHGLPHQQKRCGSAQKVVRRSQFNLVLPRDEGEVLQVHIFVPNKIIENTSSE